MAEDKYQYQVLTQDEQDDIVVEFMKAQERDLFCHQINAERYEKMLRTLPAGDWKTRVEKLHKDTKARMAEVSSIIEGTKPQMPLATRLAAATKRLSSKAG
jgi:DNA-directed RNA polymerase subunit F